MRSQGYSIHLAGISKRVPALKKAGAHLPTLVRVQGRIAQHAHVHALVVGCSISSSILLRVGGRELGHAWNRRHTTLTEVGRLVVSHRVAFLDKIGRLIVRPGPIHICF